MFSSRETESIVNCNPIVLTVLFPCIFNHLKRLKSLEEKEKFYLEEAGMFCEKAKEYYLANNKDGTTRLFFFFGYKNLIFLFL